MIIIKTEKEIGEFLHNSNIDDIPLRRIDSLDELDGLDECDYQVIKTPSSPIVDIEKAKRDSLGKL